MADDAQELVQVLYGELRRLAGALMARRPPGQTLQPTALVHEAFLRLADNRDPNWNGRAHFFGAAAQAMREILVDEARRKRALKRGGGVRPEELDENVAAITPPIADVLALDEALSRLERDDPRKGQIVSLRYFAGLTVPEVAEVLDVSASTIERECRYIKAWLARELGPSAMGDD